MRQHQWAGLGGSTLWDTTIYYSFAEHWEVGLVGRNLWDKRYAWLVLLRGNVPCGMVSKQPRYMEFVLSARL